MGIEPTPETWEGRVSFASDAAQGQSLSLQAHYVGGCCVHGLWTAQPRARCAPCRKLAIMLSSSTIVQLQETTTGKRAQRPSSTRSRVGAKSTRGVRVGGRAWVARPTSPSHRRNPLPGRNISAEIHTKPASNRSPPNKAADQCQISAASTDSAVRFR